MSGLSPFALPPPDGALSGLTMSGLSPFALPPPPDGLTPPPPPPPPAPMRT